MTVGNSPKDQIFHSNIERYAFYDPIVALALENLDTTGYEECYTHLGERNLSRTVGSAVYYYHDMHGAREEAKKWAQNLPLKDFHCIILYGIGLGYYYDQLKSWLRRDSENILIVVEDELPVIRKFFETERASEFLSDPQVILNYFDSNRADPMNSFFNRNRLILTGYGKSGIFLTSSALYYRLKENLCVGMRNEIFSYTTWLTVIMNEIVLDRQLIFENYYSNTIRQYGSYDGLKLKNCFKNIPAVICGAGPSIVKEIEFIRSIENNAVIIASGTGMNVLNYYGILPHFGTGLDPTKSQGTRIRTNSAYEVPIFYSTRFHADSFKLIQAPKLFIQKYGGYLISEWMDNQIGLQREEFAKSGVSSTNFAMDFARVLGCNPIILVGFDLAYTDASRYPAMISEHPIDPKSSKTEISAKAETPILAVNSKGEPVHTKLDWIEEASIVQKFIKNYPDIKVINASLEGLFFREIEYAELSSLKDIYFHRSWDLTDWIHAQIQNAVLDVPKDKYMQALKALNDSLLRCKAIYADIRENLELLWRGCQEGKPLSCAPYSGRIALLESDLWEEPVYKYLMVDSSLAVDNMSIPERIYYRRFKTEISNIEKNLKELEMGLNYTAFFQETVRFHESLLNHIFSEYQEEEEALSHQKMEGPDGLDEAAQEGDCYQVTDGYLIIKDVSLGLDIKSAFNPQLLPESSKKSKVENRALSDLFLTFSGKLDGQYQKFYEDGKLFADMYYRQDQLHGPATYYHSNGQILARSWFVDGIRQGKNWQYYPSGALYALKKYKDGLIVGKNLYFYENGAVKSILHFSKGLYHGSVKLYYPNGQIKRELHFKQGVLHGAESYWMPSGALRWEVFYEDGKPSGEAKLWHGNGQLERSYIYFDDHKRYNLKEWSSDGTLVYEEENITEDLRETQKKRMSDLINAIDAFNKDLEKIQKLTRHEKRQLFY